MATEDFGNVRLTTPTLGLPFKRVHGYPKYQEDMTTCSGEDEWVVRMSDLDDILDEIIPQDDTLGGLPIHVDTLQMDGYNWLRASKVQVEPCDATRPGNPLSADPAALLQPALADTYGPLARVHIWFEPMSDTIFFETGLSAGAEFLHIAPNKLEVSEDPTGDPITSNYVAGEQAPSKANTEPSIGLYIQIPTIAWEYKVNAFVEPQWDTFFSAIGKLNHKAQQGICNGAAPETVMFSGISGVLTYRWYRRTAQNKQAWVINVKLAQRLLEEELNGVTCRYGWNHHYLPLEGIWTKPSRTLVDGTKKYMYETTDIGGLFGLI